MKSLVESLFDDDLVTKDTNIDVQTAVGLVTDHIDKKFKIKSMSSNDFIKTDHFKPGNYCYCNEYYEDGVLDMCHIIFYKAEPLPTSKDWLAGIAVSICISNEDDGTNLSRIDVGFMSSNKDNRWPLYAWNTLWDSDEYKSHSKLKSTIFDSKNTVKLIKYVDNLCQAIIDYPVDIRSHLNKNKFYF